MKRRLVAFLPLIALVALAVLFVGWSLKRDPNVKPDALVGKPLPATLVTPLAGGPEQPLTAALQGPTVVNVFASWCVPCRVEQPQLLRLKTEGVRMVGVAYKDKPAATADYLAEFGDPYAVVLSDVPGRAGIDLGVSGVPETYLVDGSGRVLFKHSAPLTDDDAAELLRRWRRLR
jgi:cytochrome c biogenesis protein CcmG/thiol:disulfide interchange protein DsbE